MVSLNHKDLFYHWNPANTQADIKNDPLFDVDSAYGCLITGVNGHKVIDGISSWWCKSLGHNHPRLKRALFAQVQSFEHVISSTTTHKTITELSERLVSLVPGMGKVFYAGDGSSAVEIAMKMSLHARMNQGERDRNLFVSLDNGYHGETCGAMSVTHLDSFKDTYDSMTFKSLAIRDLPYVNHIKHNLWYDCENHWIPIQHFLEKYAQKITAIIFEPIVQGAGGMLMYSQNFLKRLCDWSKKNGIHVIADEIMTGMGRTGKMFACEYPQITPDFMCLSKGLTSGWMPLSAVLTTHAIYDIVNATTRSSKAFVHSHTYSGHALGAAVALETLKIFEKDFDWDDYRHRCDYLLQGMQTIADEIPFLSNVRGIGMIAAADISEEFYDLPMMKSVTRSAFQKGLLIRPIGRTIYWLPPLTISKLMIDDMKNATYESLFLFCKI